MEEFCKGIKNCLPTYNSIMNFAVFFLSQPHIGKHLAANIGTGTFTGPSEMVEYMEDDSLISAK